MDRRVVPFFASVVVLPSKIGVDEIAWAIPSTTAIPIEMIAAIVMTDFILAAR